MRRELSHLSQWGVNSTATALGIPANTSPAAGFGGGRRKVQRAWPSHCSRCIPGPGVSTEVPCFHPCLSGGERGSLVLLKRKGFSDATLGMGKKGFHAAASASLEGVGAPDTTPPRGEQ